MSSSCIARCAWCRGDSWRMVRPPAHPTRSPTPHGQASCSYTPNSFTHPTWTGELLIHGVRYAGWGARAEGGRGQATSTVVLAFPFPAVRTEHPVYSFLPVCTVGLPFLLHAEFDLVASRGEVGALASGSSAPQRLVRARVEIWAIRTGTASTRTLSTLEWTHNASPARWSSTPAWQSPTPDP
jgi:hypothetical protein